VTPIGQGGPPKVERVFTLLAESLDPPVDADGEWVERSRFRGRKSFGAFQCPDCLKTWVSAHAQGRAKCGCCHCTCGRIKRRKSLVRQRTVSSRARMTATAARRASLDAAWTLEFVYFADPPSLHEPFTLRPRGNCDLMRRSLLTSPVKKLFDIESRVQRAYACMLLKVLCCRSPWICLGMPKHDHIIISPHCWATLHHQF
jgi:hypothetical protein